MKCIGIVSIVVGSLYFSFSLHLHVLYKDTNAKSGNCDRITFADLLIRVFVLDVVLQLVLINRSKQTHRTLGNQLTGYVRMHPQEMGLKLKSCFNNNRLSYLDLSFSILTRKLLLCMHRYSHLGHEYFVCPP